MIVQLDNISLQTGYAIQKPSAWTDLTNSFDTKSATQFIEAVTSATTAIDVRSSFVVASGLVVKITYTITITGTWTPTTGIGFLLQIQDSLGNDAATKTRKINGVTDQNVNLVFTANGTYEIEETYTLTAASTYLYILLSESVASGTANFTVTMPATAYYETVITETKTAKIDCGCTDQNINLQWLNYFGGFDSWNFSAEKDFNTDILSTETSHKNKFPNWPNSHGEFADTEEFETLRTSRTQILVRSQNVTLANLQAIKYIKTSPLVQIVNSIYDRRTVLVDNQSFKEYSEDQKIYTIQFIITYTDDIPSQSL